MKRLSFFSLLALCAFAAAVSLNSCQKEAAQEVAQTGLQQVSDRAANKITYGVTLYNGTNPCEIIGIDQGTGNVIPTANPITAFYVDNAGNVNNLDNIKGICLTSWGQYFLTTGSPANPIFSPTSVYNNALFKVNPATGQCSYASTSNIGTVSDLEFYNGNFYGLRSNTNAIIEIVDNNNNYGTYNGPFAITGIANGYTLKGLSLVRDNNGTYLVGCATNNNPNNPAKLYRLPFNGGFATFLTDLAPAADLGAGHCGIGFDLDLNNMVVNRVAPSPTFVLGLNAFNWGPLGATTNTTFWGGANYNYEDLTSSIY